jgi:hypothetical protein
MDEFTPKSKINNKIKSLVKPAEESLISKSRHFSPH